MVSGPLVSLPATAHSVSDKPPGLGKTFGMNIRFLLPVSCICLASCSLVTVPVKTAGSIVTTPVKTTGDIVTAPFDAVGRSRESSDSKPKADPKQEDNGRPAPLYEYLEETRTAEPAIR